MLSLPSPIPPIDNSAFLRTTHRPRDDSPPPSLGTLPAPQQPQSHRQRQQRDEERKIHNARSPLAQLALAEASIEHHKAQVRNWGSSWIRPPGIAKTLQAMTEEAAEREEQAEIERQEAGLRDMQAQQQLQEAQQQAEEAGEGEGEGEPSERDLDDDVPEAQDVTFNEDSMMEGSQLEAGDEEVEVEMEEAELTGAAQDEEDLGVIDDDMTRDLDDSIPEAGSYQHTDTEAEDSDSESELVHDSPVRGRAARGAVATPVDMTNREPPGQMMNGLQQRMRGQVGAGADALPRSPGSLNLSSSILDSSMTGSSPVVQRGNARGRGGRRGRMS